MKANTDWTDVKAAANQMAGNWRSFDSFAWSRGYGLAEADNWMIWYTSHRDAGLLAQSNEKVINERLQPFAEADDPDVVLERHSHFAVGHVDGFSIRVFRNDGSITLAFEEFCRIQADLDNYPVLSESDYSEREFQATLENYAIEMWPWRKELPEGWEGEVYNWFSNNGHDRHTENRDDLGGWAPREAIIEALQDLGLMPALVVESQRGETR
jgi:hypothetical protein